MSFWLILWGDRVNWTGSNPSSVLDYSRQSLTFKFQYTLRVIGCLKDYLIVRNALLFDMLPHIAYPGLEGACSWHIEWFSIYCCQCTQAKFTGTQAYRHTGINLWKRKATEKLLTYNLVENKPCLLWINTSSTNCRGFLARALLLVFLDMT